MIKNFDLSKQHCSTGTQLHQHWLLWT